jgi:hypothetical protein
MEDLEDIALMAPLAHHCAPAGVVMHQQKAPELTADDLDGFLPEAYRLWVKTFGCAHNTSDAEYMAGQLAAYGFRRAYDPPQSLFCSAWLPPNAPPTSARSRLLEDADREAADLWLINTCTVKNPSQAAMSSLLARGRALGKALVVAGCVPQGDRRIPELQDLSLLGVKKCLSHTMGIHAILYHASRTRTCSACGKVCGDENVLCM